MQDALSPGEQLVWATTFAQALAGGSHPPLAIRLATRAVQRLREVEADKLPRRYLGRGCARCGGRSSSRGRDRSAGGCRVRARSPGRERRRVRRRSPRGGR